MEKNSREEMSGKKVVIGLTGRLDSAIAAFLLKKQGMQVIGLTIVTVDKTFSADEKFLPKCHISDLDKVKAFCESINIPFYATDSKIHYFDNVMDPYIASRLLGMANHSCFNCTGLRLSVLYSKMKALNADYIATGHYCKVNKNLNSEEFFIHSCKDVKSDQSFLMSGLKQDFLKHLILPLGELGRSDVLKIAHNFGIKVDENPSSSDFCLKDGDNLKELLAQHIPKSFRRDGQFVNLETDSIIGDHSGMLTHFMTEKGIDVKQGVSLEKSLEVVGYDYATNMIQVGKKDRLSFKGVQLVSLKMAPGMAMFKPLLCFVKIKSSSEFYKAYLYYKNNNSGYLDFEDEVYPVIENDLVVIYSSNRSNSKVIGSATVGKRGKFDLIDRVSNYRDVREDEDGNIVKEEISMFKF